MPRAIVYPPRERDGEIATARQPSDAYGEKLAKYVPAEVLGGFVPLVTLAEKQLHNPQWGLITCFVVGLIMTPLYLQIRGFKSGQSQRWYTYVLSIVAFVGWAMGTKTTIAQLLFPFEPDAGPFILAIVVFAIPGIDECFTNRS